MIVTEVTDADLSHWIAGTRLFETADSTYFVVSADLNDYPADSSVTFIRRPTVVLYCDPGGAVTDLIPDHSFDPGTSAEDAIAALGFTFQGA